jgi:PhzF family phenazine biosynthesis protein
MDVFRFKKIDAFTGENAAGNPAGCIYLNHDGEITAAAMQKIAKELKGYVNEVAFLFPVEDGVRLKYYSSECEVEFCGHASIAIMHDWIRSNEELRQTTEVALHVNAGKLTVFNHIREEDAVYVMAPEPQFLPCALSTDEIAGALAMDASQLETGAPVRIVNAGLRTLIVPLASLDACLAAFPPQEPLRRFCLDTEVDIVLVYTAETQLGSSQYRTRVFAPKFGYLEDPATGSGNAAFGYYLIQNGLWNSNVVIEQGPSKMHPNIVKLRRMSRGATDRILFGGSSLVRICGEYFLHG